MTDKLIEQSLSQFPVALAVIFVGYFFINKLENYNKAIMEIAINSTKAIENCTHMMSAIDDNMREIRTTQLSIEKDISSLKNK